MMKEVLVGLVQGVFLFLVGLAGYIAGMYAVKHWVFKHSFCVDRACQFLYDKNKFLELLW